METNGNDNERAALSVVTTERVKRALEARAERNHRGMSGEAAHIIETELMRCGELAEAK